MKDIIFSFSMKEIKTNNKTRLKIKPDIYYVCVGASCDYAHEERASAGAYIMEQNGKVVDTYVIADHHTTEG